MKRIISIGLCLMLVFGMVSTVFAGSDETKEINKEKEKQESMEVSGDNGEKSINAIDLRYENAIKKFQTRDTGGSLPKKIDMKVAVCTQAKDNWCGPATSNQVVTYINGSSQSQEKIASAFGIKDNDKGTDLATIVNYIKKQTGKEYKIYSNPTENDLFISIQTAALGKKPPILRMKVLKSYGFPYDIKSSGHFMNASGYREYGGEILVTDPAVKNKMSNNTTGKYYVSVKTIYQGTSNHFAKEIAF